MFTKAMYETGDMITQHELLNKVSELLDEGILKTTLNETFTPINAENVKKAHALLESGRTIGKIVLEVLIVKVRFLNKKSDFLLSLFT